MACDPVVVALAADAALLSGPEAIQTWYSPTPDWSMTADGTSAGSRTAGPATARATPRFDVRRWRGPRPKLSTSSGTGCALPAPLLGGRITLFADNDARPDCGTQLGELAAPAPEAAPSSGRDEARRSIDALVSASLRYSRSKQYLELLAFIRRFHWYAPLNALLIHVQRPGAQFVAPAVRWYERYGRKVLPEAQALLILQPFGPVMFVYDVGQTRPVEDEYVPTLPLQVTDPFHVRGSAPAADIAEVTRRTLTNAVRDGVRVVSGQHGSQSAGWISTSGGGMQPYQVRMRPRPEYLDVPVRYDLCVNEQQIGLTRYNTLAHELGHLYCGHVGTPDAKWWPDRRHLDQRTAEFEAESVAAMVLQRLDPSIELSPYLHQYLQREPTVPEDISLERITAAAELILSMGQKERLEPRVANRRKNERA